MAVSQCERDLMSILATLAEYKEATWIKGNLMFLAFDQDIHRYNNSVNALVRGKMVVKKGHQLKLTTKGRLLGLSINDALAKVDKERKEGA